jgi:4-hydroxybenzoyl-CoA thioesterase
MPWYGAGVRVRFGEIDRAGIVYYPRFFHYFHIAFEEFFADCVGVPYHVMLDEKRIGFPAVRVECDYESPLKFGDTLEVRISVVRVGRTSVTFRYQVWKKAEAARCADARVTVVCVQMDTFRPMTIPEPYRGAFLKYLDDEIGERPAGGRTAARPGRRTSAARRRR